MPGLLPLIIHPKSSLVSLRTFDRCHIVIWPFLHRSLGCSRKNRVVLVIPRSIISWHREASNWNPPAASWIWKFFEFRNHGTKASSKKNFALGISATRPVAANHGYLPSLAFIIARRRSTTDVAIKPPGKDWPKALEKRHPVLDSRKIKAVEWNRHDNNIYDIITHWFQVVGKELQDPVILPENVYNMGETGVMLRMLGSVKVLVGKDDARNYRGAGVKRTMVAAIECISADGRSLLPLIIWPASAHRSNWTTYPTPRWHYACSESGYTDSKISLE